MTRDELQQILREMLDEEAKPNVDWARVQQISTETRRRLSDESAPEVPHHLWHFLADFDIRQKDQSYGDEQRAEVRDYLGA